MSRALNPINVMLKLALNTLEEHHEYYENTAANEETAEVKALLLLLAETEAEMIGRIQDMYIDGIVEEIDEISKIGEVPAPDDTLYDSARESHDERIFVCNEALRQELKAYTFFLSLATRVKSNVISHLFEYFAYLKTQQIEKIRRVCSTF